MGESSENQERYYKDYWQGIEEKTDILIKKGDSYFDKFLKDYLTCKAHVAPREKDIYLDFEKFWKDNDKFTKKEKLIDMLRFSNYFYQIAKTEHPDKKINAYFKHINQFDIKVSYPFLLELLYEKDNNTISGENLSEILAFITTYIFRRSVCNVPTNALNKVFVTLGKDIKEVMKENNIDYTEACKSVIISKKGKQRFPEDEEFEAAMKAIDIFTNKKIITYYLEVMENWNNKEQIKIEPPISIEHIMPQKLTTEWKKELGENWKETHEKYLNTIGNLTLTGYNSEYSNKSFLEKRDMKNGFKDSRLYLNKSVSQFDKWNEESIKERAEILIKQALEIWKYPEAKYINKNKYSLADNFDFTNTKIEKFEFMETLYDAGSWKGFFKKILSILYDIDPKILTDYADKADDYAIYTEEKINNDKAHYIKFIDNIYIYNALSTQTIIGVVKDILERYDIDEDEVTFYLKNDN